MLLLWRIRYLDTRDKQFKDRDLWLDTNALDSVMKAAVEAMNELRGVGRDREVLRYRHLFREHSFSDIESSDLGVRYGSTSAFCVSDYFEDEHGWELTKARMAVILTGNPGAIMFPAGAQQHVIDFTLADKRPIPIDEISLSQSVLDTLGYFARDLRELLASALFKNGAGTLGSGDGSGLTLRTATTDEELRSFVTIFRRLYMQGEPANFSKAVAAFAEAIGGYPLAAFVKGIVGEYEAGLNSTPDFVPPFANSKNWTFFRKRLIDVFLYTQYAHQPSADRSRQFDRCLREVGTRDELTWLFLTEIWACSLHMANAGRIIAQFYDQYCQYHGVSGDVLSSVSRESSGIGTLETKEARRERVLCEKADELAKTLWEKEGRPEGGHACFVADARTQLDSATSEGREVSA